MAYEKAVVQSVTLNETRYGLLLSAVFSGTDVPNATLAGSLPWDYSAKQLAEWSVSRLEILNGLYATKTGLKIKVGDELPTQREAVVPASDEPAEPGPGGAIR